MKKTLTLIALLCALVALPFVVTQNGAYEGSDGEAEAVINQIAPSYQPWAAPLFEPASSEIESLLFTLQGSLGAAVIFYILGFYHGRSAGKNEVEGQNEAQGKANSRRPNLAKSGGLRHVDHR